MVRLFMAGDSSRGWGVRGSETGAGRSVPNNVNAECVEKRYDANLETRARRASSPPVSYTNKGGGTLLVAREGGAPTPSELAARDDVLGGVPMDATAGHFSFSHSSKS